MPSNTTVEEKNRFPARTTLISIIGWFIPMIVFGFVSISSIDLEDTTGIAILVALTVLGPVSAYVLYRIDKQQANGHVTVWGFR